MTSLHSPSDAPRVRSSRAIPYTLLGTIGLFLLNGFLAFRLFKTDYIDYPGSIEGAFISLAAYIQRHHPMHHWFPLWYAGIPFSFTYQPALHYVVAWTSSLAGWAPARAYHAVTAITYSLGPVTFFLLARRLCQSQAFALAAALIYSLFSPSLLLVPAIRNDTHGLLHARRFQALVVYGEGPNVTGLMLLPLALLCCLWWVESRSRVAFALAAAAVAAVVVTNWPSTTALTITLACLVLSVPWRKLPTAAASLALVGIAAYLLASPFALPSVLLRTYANAHVMGDAPVRNANYWIFLSVAVALIALVRIAVSRATQAIRFVALWAVAFSCVVLGVYWFGVNLVPQSARFHLAWEMPLILIFTLLAESQLRSRRAQQVAAACLALFCIVQAYQYRQYIRTAVRRIDITQRLEYQAADWLRRNRPEARVYAPGSVAFWLNAFTDNPQVTGCCDQSIINEGNRIAAFIIPAGHGSTEEDAELSLLWLKAYGVRYAIAGGPATQEFYKVYTHPDKFEGRLPVRWSYSDDHIYELPWRGDPLARAVPRSELVTQPPQNGIDTAGLRRFVAALDNPLLPSATAIWPSPDHADLRATLAPDQVLSIPINWDPHWSAQANGHPVPVEKDGLGFLVVAPGYRGDCQVALDWRPGAEVYLANAASGIMTLTLLGILFSASRSTNESQVR